MNLRRPLPLFMLTLLLAGTWSCDHLSSHLSKDDSSKSSSSQESGVSSEIERTRELEKKADDIDRQAEDLKTMEGSDQDKIDAYNKMQQDQQDLSATAEGSEGGEGGN
jgi:hypothetical protein